MRENFERALKFVLQHEGGLVEDPRDPGGVTKYGISQRAYPHLDIRKLTVEQAREIYLRDYWIRAGCDALPWPRDLLVFDTAVNLGIRRAREFLRTRNDHEYLLRRIFYYLELAHRSPRFRRFLRGWLNRVKDLYEAMDDGTV